MILLFAVLFVVAQSLDLATYLMAPRLESMPLPMLVGPIVMFGLKIGAVVAILAGAAWLAYRGREKAPILTWAKAVLLVGAAVAFVSFGFNVAHL